ncbi:MAG: DUF2218 domain-containing protein [Actinomycetaceae bacterium]|nr:DUF2218 domain-containing protein [Actinomycetaceae bacterium]
MINSTTPPLTSIARVATSSPARYARQLVSHMSHKITATWDAETEHGVLNFDREGMSLGTCELSCGETTLILTLHSDEEEIPILEEIIGSHLVRFGSKDSLVVSWVRSDGSNGTTQGPYTPGE